MKRYRDFRMSRQFLMLCTIALCVLIIPRVTFAEERHGLVTSGPCPLTCKQSGLSADSCREWQVGDTCNVEDFTQPAGHRSMIKVPTGDIIAQNESGGQVGAGTRRGLVTSSTCPYTCKNANVPKDFCREWTEGTNCYVEDFSQAPGHRTMIRLP